jgi:type IX secretion system PorP/SprF family membrane protein
MNKIYILIFLVMSVIGLRAQQETQFTQHPYAILPFNPGYAGSNEAICATTIFRQQWTGFKDPSGDLTSPQDILFSIDAPVSILRGGVGVSIIKDKIGYEDNTEVKLGYAYRLPIGRSGGVLGIGAQVGFLSKTIDFTKFIYIDQNDPRLIGRKSESDMFTDISFGLFYKVPNLYYVGIASTQMLEAQAPIANTGTGVKLKRHYFINGGYEWIYPDNPSLVFEPSLFIKTDFVSAQYDISVIARWNNMFWGGLNYRLQDAIGLVLGVSPFQTGAMRGLKIGYSYDFTTSDLGRQGRSSGSHEIMLKYCFKIVKTPVVSGYKNSLLLGN